MSSSVFSAEARQWLEQPGRFGVLATIDPDGSPHQAVVWFAVTDAGILLNSAEGRRWPANLRRDRRASFLVEDRYQYVSVTGTVDVIEDQERAQADIARLARAYNADNPAAAEEIIENTFRKEKRVGFLLRPDHVTFRKD